MKMLENFNKFVDTMIEEQNNFENMQTQINSREEGVLSVVEALGEREQEIINAIKMDIADTKDEDMHKIFEQTSKCLIDAMTYANKEIEQAVKGMTFIQDFEKHFTVSVFGKVKAGKSYIGNLIMGQPIRKAKISSSYDKLEDLTVHVYDRGKMYEQNKLSTSIEQKECNG